MDLLNTWRDLLVDEYQAQYMKELRSFIRNEAQLGKDIFPAETDVFNALKLTPFEKVKVVIIGQDPYHGPGQAHGLCFSVKPGVQLPPSLQNIFKELSNDLSVAPPRSGDLSNWARQGVLLLNATLTVEAHRAGSHQNRGWERFTDRVIYLLNEKRLGIVFILWGSYAQKKGSIIDRNRHLVIESPHPSPLSAHRGFFGSRPFSKTNQYLIARGQDPIVWVDGIRT